MAYGEPHQPREHEGVAQEGCGEGADDARAARGLAAQSVGQRGAGHRQRVREEEQCAERIARPVRQAHLLKERAGDHEGERQPAHDAVSHGAARERAFRARGFRLGFVLHIPSLLVPRILLDARAE